MMNRIVLITGVTGQDGSYMVDYLLRNTNHMIYGLLRHSSNPNLRNIKHLIGNPRFKTVMGDLTDLISIEDVVKKLQPDYFINFAAQSFVAESWNTPVSTFVIDALGTLHCLEAIRKHRPTCRFYSAGSSEEMGDVLYSPQDLKHPIRPRSPYGAAKSASRHLVKVYRESYNLYAVHGILFNHESERRGEYFVTRKITKGVARIRHAIENDLPFAPLELGNLDSQRDWSHAEDFVDGVWRMLNQEEYVQELANLLYIRGSILLPGSAEALNVKSLSKNVKEYILSSNETHSVREFVELAFLAANIPIARAPKDAGDGCAYYLPLTTQTYLPVVKINPKFYRPAEVDLLIGDSRPAREELAWSPKVPFRTLVERMVANDIKEFGLE